MKNEQSVAQIPARLIARKATQLAKTPRKTRLEKIEENPITLYVAKLISQHRRLGIEVTFDDSGGDTISTVASRPQAA